jgi:hypothetical protein
VHLAAAHVEIDVVVGDDARELLPDPAHLEDELVRFDAAHAGSILTRRREGRAHGPPLHASVRLRDYSAAGTFSLPAMILAL